MTREELFKGLSEEQIKKLEACKNNEEILALAKAEGIELTEEQLEAVNGGGCTLFGLTCPACGSRKIKETNKGDYFTEYHCENCGKNFSH